MSKVSSQGGFTEKYLGINRLPPPPVHDVPSADLPMSITLGSYTLHLDSSTGQWNIHDSLINTLHSQIHTLQQQLALTQRQAALTSSSPSPTTTSPHPDVVLDLQHRQVELEKVNIQLLNEVQQMKLKTKILTAMCAIAEGDYKALCEEVEKEGVQVGGGGGGGRGSRMGGRSSSEMKRESSFSRTQTYSEAERTIKAPLRYQVQA